jgi:hypothetical protein
LQKTAAAGGAIDRRLHSKSSPATLLVGADDSSRSDAAKAIEGARGAFHIVQTRFIK